MQSETHHGPPRYAELQIAIPVYNEGANIGATLAAIEDRVTAPYRIFIVYDFETDDTLPVVHQLNAQGRSIQLLKNRYGRGAANAIRTALTELDGAILITMADLADDMADVDAMFAQVNDGSDLVCGSRYAKGGRQIGGPRLKRHLSRLAGLSLHYLAGIPTRDVTNSFKLYTSRVIEHLTIESTGGFEIGMEIVVKAHLLGFRVTEIPTTWTDRAAGESRFRLWSWLPRYLRWYWYALIHRRRRAPAEA